MGVPCPLCHHQVEIFSYPGSIWSCLNINFLILIAFMRNAQLAIAMLFISFMALGQNAEFSLRYTLSGFVKDLSSGEELTNATLYVKELNTGTTSNLYGFYSLTLPAGNYNIEVSYLGYQAIHKEIELKENVSLNLELEGLSTQLQEIVVSSEAADENVRGVGMSHIDLSIEQIKKLPALLGEPDIIKSIQMLPGVTSAGEGTSSFYVRGGSADQNLVLIDEAPVYDVSHLFGLFSVFNSDIIKNAELYKGGIPAKYGGRLSSLLEINTKDGNAKQFAGSGAIGTLAAKIMLEGPIIKDKASYLLAGRRSFFDIFMKFNEETKDDAVKFHDLNLKLNYKPNNNNRVFLSAYLGRDIYQFGKNFQMDWGNKTTSARWNHLFNEKLFSNLTFIYSDFDYKLALEEEANAFVWKANQQELSLKEDISWFADPRLKFHLGYQGVYRQFQPGIIQPNAEGSIFKETRLQEQYALDHGLYLSVEHQLSDRLALDYGLRFSFFQNIGEATVYKYANREDRVDVEIIDSLNYKRFENVKTFQNLEPRFSARYQLAADQSIKFSYQRMVQYIHLISNSTVPIPFNTWAPSAPYLNPQKSDQLALGYFKNFQNNTYELSVESFYKKSIDITEFADNAQLFFNPHLPTEFRQGDAEAYGLEFYIQKNKGNFKGHASYTWSKAEVKADGVNNGIVFPANHDRRHNFNLALTYDWNPQWNFGANFTYMSGRPITLPTGKYQYDGYQIDLYSERNGYRLPSYHRFDLSATNEPKKNAHRKIKSTRTFGIYNLYNRQNPFTIYTRIKQDDKGNIIGDGTEKEARMVYLFGFFPYATWSFTF